MPPSILVAVLLLCLGTAPAAAPGARQEPAPAPAPGDDPAPEAADPQLAEWRARVARDARLRFTPRTGELARQDLDAGLLNDRERAVALFALGAAREARERPRLEAAALVGTLDERRAALLGLGELGLRVDTLLGEELFDPEVAGCAFLAILRRGGVGSRRLASELARDAAPDVRAAVVRLAGFVIDPRTSVPSEAAGIYLDLRWEAARAYGLIDGRSWEELVFERWIADQAFLDATVLVAAAAIDRPGVDDHLLRQLLERETPQAVRACVRGMPAELAALVQHGLWRPAGPEAWAAIVREVDERGLEQEAEELLRQALEVPAVRLHAQALLARAGLAEGLDQLAREWGTLSTDERVQACAAWGHSGDEQALPWLLGRERDPSERVVAAVWIARARLVDAEARERVEAVLSDPTDERWDDWAEVALSVVEDRWVGDLLAGTLDLLDGPELVRVAAELVLAGRLAPLDRLRPYLREGLPEGELTLLGLRAFARRGSGEDLVRLARLFPFDGEGPFALEINAALARAMIRDRNVRTLPVLRAAIWDDPFDRSVLAALLTIEVAGIYTLREEVVDAPADASKRDFRRIGFALGEWGGLDQLQRLEERGRLAPGDPVLQGAFLGAMAGRTQ